MVFAQFIARYNASDDNAFEPSARSTAEDDTLHDGIPNDESWGAYDGQCRACDEYGRVDATLLCEFCAGQLERDLIRLQDWDSTVSGYALPTEAREKLRKQVIKQYGKALELIADPNPPRRKRRHRRKSKKRKT